MLHDDPEMALEDRTRFVGIIVSEAERLTRLINQILDMAKLESGRAEWTSGAVDIGEVARDAMVSLGQLFREKDVALEGDIPPEGPVVQADRAMIKVVLTNLLSNAIKFTRTTEAPRSTRLREATLESFSSSTSPRPENKGRLRNTTGLKVQELAAINQFPFIELRNNYKPVSQIS